MVTAFRACDSCRTRITEPSTVEVTGGGMGWNQTSCHPLPHPATPRVCLCLAMMSVALA